MQLPSGVGEPGCDTLLLRPRPRLDRPAREHRACTCRLGETCDLFLRPSARQHEMPPAFCEFGLKRGDAPMQPPA